MLISNNLNEFVFPSLLTEIYQDQREAESVL